MAEQRPINLAALEKASDPKNHEDQKIASLRKTYEEAAKKASDAAKYVGLPPEVAELRARKQEAFNALHAAEEAQGKRIKDEAANRRAAAPAAKP